MRFVAFGILTLLADQISKYVITSTMAQGQSIAVLSPVFFITYVLNPGAAFGLLANKTEFFILVSIIVVIGIMVGYRYLPGEWVWAHTALGLISGGAIGNLIDRIRIGRVIDFLDFRVWPVFNLADTAIVIGALLLILDVWRNDKEEKQRIDSGAE
ncbi:signal peptidase II . Aspartic peptidase. MEROPS family A08 [Desulfotomaculum arcticum]|uniref:Lipoprotein signal peptidase n=1 Tax=Desulfotruncus arcticus DSM 17038 TaxID=1121424 RepID=A0A1I2XY21_9FIRM|nr:signal peptidase II [Desulfotruncus arcticus]SFH17967.1 signal peptidase II . Aspartic peptidase. MEROPS family A08 [Desulfotomaculum arcticum] [Desulfotruncus arcticus DSM 17038]